jgi:hypothetical protein
MTDFDVLVIFTCGVSIGTMLGFMGGYKLGGAAKRKRIVGALDELFDTLTPEAMERYRNSIGIKEEK